MKYYNGSPEGVDLNLRACFLDQVKTEVDAFFKQFDDHPSKTSRWGHHYFCKDDGGLLIYNDQTPTEHQCSICGKVYSDDLLNGVWVYMYRNQGVINAWKSALLFRETSDDIYLRYLIDYAQYYASNYLNFELHNKEGRHYESIETMAWGCSRIMPQSLNEAIWVIRLINGLELVKDALPKGFISALHEQLFSPMFHMFKPQVDKIHNISCWLNSAIGVMGLFSNDHEMISFAFEGPFNIHNQLIQGVTKDYFWYEGSIHYNFFTLEGITNLLLFTKLYDYEFKTGLTTVEAMLKQAYNYAFDNHQLPNPNDGWPNVNLKSYSYIYALGSKIYGLDSDIGRILISILSKNIDRKEFPLSKPYYFNNDVSLEEFIFCPKARYLKPSMNDTSSILFESSYCGLIKDDVFNVFFKYGHNGPSHAHPDKMNIEVVVDNKSLSRDLSNSGYGNVLCNEWHRVSASHNTVVVDGQNHTSVKGGICHEMTDRRFKVEAKNVYDGIDFIRAVSLTPDGLSDEFSVINNQGLLCDYFFHVEGELLTALETQEIDGHYNTNGYQHLENIVRVVTNQEALILTWQIGDTVLKSKIDLSHKSLILADSPDNPITGYRKSLILRSVEHNPVFKVNWTKESNND